MMVYCILSWAAFSLALFLADKWHRKKEAMAGGLLILVLVSVLSLLSGFAVESLQTGVALSMSFLLTGIFFCTMAVSRVIQMLSWPRTWLASALGLVFYLVVTILQVWLLATLNYESIPW